MGRWGRPVAAPVETPAQSGGPVRVARRVEPTPRTSEAEERPKGVSPALVLGVLAGAGFLFLVTVAVGGYFLFVNLTPDQAAAPPTSQTVDTPPPPKPVAENPDAVKRVKKATVYIRVTNWAGGKSSGSGFFAGEKGYVLTNAHVVGYGPNEVREPSKIEVIVNSGEIDQRTLTATLYGVDADRDLALLKVSSTDVPSPLALKSAAGLRETDDLVIFGYPFGEALSKSISVNTTTVSGLPREEGELKHIQVNGGMHPGNSGGPVTNKAGDVLGVSVAGIRGTQINFAIPGEKAEAFVREQIDAGGSVNLGRLAANTTPVPNPNPNPFPNPNPNPRPNPFPRPNPQPNDPPREAMKLAPVVPVEVTPAPITGEKAEVKLPSAIGEICVGGGGRYVCLLLPKTRQVAVYDVSQGKVAKYFPVAAEDVRIAAGMNKLLVVSREPATVTRYDFAKLEKEVTVPAPFTGTLKAVAMGSASAGPLLIHYGSGTGALDRSPTILVDPATLKEVRVGDGVQMHACYRDHLHFRASPDGTTFGVWCTSHSPSGVTTLRVGTDSVKSSNLHDSFGHVVPGPDGTIFTGQGMFTTDLKGLGKERRGAFTIPAVSGNHYLEISPEGNGAGFPIHAAPGFKATVKMTGDSRPIVTLPKVDMPMGGENWVGHDFTQDKRFVFVPEAKAIVVVPKVNDQLVVLKFDMEAALEKAGIDYLFVSTRAPVAVAGKKYEYAIGVRSKKGGVKYKLESGPEGMKVSADGKVTWEPPADWTEATTVLVTVSDTSGQEVFHTFSLAPGAEPGKVVVNPVPNPLPRPQPNPDPEPADVGNELVVAAAKVQTITPTEAKDNTTVTLPGPVDAVCVAGGGRFLVYRIPKARQLVVFDVSQGRVAKYIPLAEDTALFAGGMNKLYVLNPAANVIQKWDLAKMEKESTVQFPLRGSPKQILMGHLTDGPLYVGGSKVGEVWRHYAFLNPRTWKEVAIPVEGGRAGGGPSVSDDYPPQVRVSGDGRVYSWWTPGLSPSGLTSMVIGSKGAKGYWEHTSVGAITPGPDGTLFTGSGVYTSGLKKVTEKAGATFPATSGPWYFEVVVADRFTAPRPKPGEPAKAPQLVLKMLGDNRPLVTLNDLAGFDAESDQFGFTKPGTVGFADRVQLVPEADLLVVLNAAGTKLHLHRFDLKGRLAKTDVDYLLVVSRPPGVALRGTKYQYTPTVWSKKGGVKVKVESGPDGIAVAGGAVTWDVPAAATDATHDVILTVSDASGQETFHTFKVTVQDKPPPK